jgi:hypothetical protein
VVKLVESLVHALHLMGSVRSPGGRLATTHADMKPPYARVPQTALAALAAAVSIWLVVFFLPGSRMQPMPLLPALGSANGPAIAKVPAPSAKPLAEQPAAKLRRPVVFAPALAPPIAPPAAPAQTAVSRPVTVHRLHRAAPARRLHRAPAPRRPRHSAPVRTAAPAPAPATAAPATDPPKGVAHGWERHHATPPRGKAKGWNRHHAQASAAATSVHGQGNVLRRLSEHHHSLPPGQAKKPKANGHHNGNHAGQGAPGQGAPGNQDGSRGRGGGGKK